MVGKNTWRWYLVAFWRNKDTHDLISSIFTFFIFKSLFLVHFRGYFNYFWSFPINVMPFISFVAPNSPKSWGLWISLNDSNESVVMWVVINISLEICPHCGLFCWLSPIFKLTLQIPSPHCGWFAGDMGTRKNMVCISWYTLCRGYFIKIDIINYFRILQNFNV